MSADFDHVISPPVKHQAVGIVELGVVSSATPPFASPLDESHIAFGGITPIPQCDGRSRDQQLPSHAASVYRGAGIVDEYDPSAVARHPDRNPGHSIPPFPVNTLECA